MKQEYKKIEPYQSYAMYHPDGSFMCYCDEKKAHWYIRKDIAYWIDDKKFQLLFEPNGYGKINDPFYNQVLKSECVVCGQTHALNKHHVVPYVFRKRFPLEYKSNNHHDVLSTCLDCHEKYESFATVYKQKLASQLDVPFNCKLTEEDRRNNDIIKTRKLLDKYDNGLLLDNQGNKVKIPEEKILSLRAIAQQQLTVRAQKEFWADAIVQNVIENDQIQEFIENWRSHFIQYAKPQFLPKFWSIKHKELIG